MFLILTKIENLDFFGTLVASNQNGGMDEGFTEQKLLRAHTYVPCHGSPNTSAWHQHLRSSDYELIMNDSVYRTDAEKRIAILDKLVTREARAYWSFCHSIRLRCQRIFDVLHTLNADLCTECNGQQE